MPTYQYRCTACGRDLEVVQKFSDATLTVCPTCQGALRKVFNAVGVVFKGSGFYRTDSRKSSDGDGGSGAEKGEKTGDKGTEKKESGEKMSEPKAESSSSAGKDTKASTGSGSNGTSTSGSTKAASGSSTGGASSSS